MLTPLLLEAHNPSSMTGRGNNTYLLDAGAGAAALVDAGIGDPRHLAAIAGALHHHTLALGDVLVTHAHADHASGAAALAAAYPDARFAKYPWPGEDERYPVDWQYVAAGAKLRIGTDLALDVLHTGGHSPDHLVFWHADSRGAFTGDLVVEGSSVMIQWSRGGDLAQYLRALERLLELEPRTLYPAHGPVITRPAAVLTAYLDHRRLRERQVISALQAGRFSVQAIVDFIYDGLEPSLVPAAAENVRAHLEKLRAEGLAQCENDRWSM